MSRKIVLLEAQEIIFAITNAAPAASPPITIVCDAPRRRAVPVNCAFKNPNTANAAKVTPADHSNPCHAFERRMYGASGMNPPATYESAIVDALVTARFGSGS